MRIFVACLAATGAILIMPSPANSEECGATATLYSGEAECVRGADAVRNLYDSASSEGYTYELESRCKQGEANCGRDQRICRDDSGRPGTWYLLLRTSEATGEVTRMGIVCLSAPEEEELAVITPAMVRREMQRLAWPAAELQVQPPDGQTLVNFDTNFFTRHVRPVTRSVTLLGQRVTIEAAPVEYHWHFGDGSTEVSTGPGAPYPDLDITHAYADTGTVEPRVDTTYRGRYRVNRDGWQQVPGSLTVQGETVALRIRSATPRLVGSDSRG